MLFKTQNLKVTISLIILIFALIFCNIKKLYNRVLKNTEDTFYNTPTTTTPTTTSAVNTRFNEIVYGMNPNCIKDNTSPDANKLCPGSHPNIPCSRVGCPGSNTKLTDDMKRDIYLYAYLTGLLETADVWEKDTDKYWYTTNWQEGSD